MNQNLDTLTVEGEEELQSLWGIISFSLLHQNYIILALKLFLITKWQTITFVLCTFN